MESVDLVVVGAGWSGLAAIKTYRDLNPDSNVLLLEAADSVGGVWAKHRLYKGLKSNNMLGTYEFSDFPMDEATFGVKTGEHIPGEIVQRYLEAYAERFGFTDRIRLGHRVESAQHNLDSTWQLKVSHGEELATIDTKKLIVATGITSQAYLPDFEGQDAFGAPIFHCRDMQQHEPQILKAGERATVFGGTKSAWDAAYACATSGMQVDWIIRESGHGPNWMAPPYVTPLKKWLEKLVTTRLLTWFSPCIWGDADGYTRARSFLHGTWLGRKIVDAFWAVLADDVVQLNGFDKHPEVKKLQPWISPFWIASSLSILNYPTNFFDLIKDGTIKVYIAELDHLSDHTVHLSTGEELKSTALICSTGWRATPNLKFLPEGIDRELGFPWSTDPLDEEMVKAADEEILRRFPRLRDQPTPNPKYKPLNDQAEAAVPHPFRLARFMVPLSQVKDRSLAFMGITMTINTTIIAQAQALWIAAYFGNHLTPTATEHCPAAVRAASDIKVEDDAELNLAWETALHSEFGKYRYPGGFGRRNPDFVFDAIPYVDLMLRDLGLSHERKEGMLSRCFSPYGTEDYKGLVEEWKAKVLNKP
ncbi:flavin-binding monooxygenase-like protein [Penicillium brasilianum]|uniref:Flavin-binding monooxygenase-like protein n=1 Tax=Penicillium brasilianum TaxID=104259 RepID=A0A1S9RA76_PENBI|nr:flavin-binding monooxygenase-like protein [Penicillium brasilianum]